MDLNVSLVGLSLEVSVECRLVVLLLLSAVAGYALEVDCHLAALQVVGVLGGAPPPDPLDPAAPPPWLGLLP